MRLTSLGLATDVALRALEGAQVTERGSYLVVRSPDNPDFWWGNFLILPGPPEPGSATTWLARFVAEFPAARHVTLAVDSPAPGPSVPPDFLAAGLEPERATVLTAASLNPPPRPNHQAEIRPLESSADWQASLDLAVRCFGPQEAGHYLARRNAARRRLTQAGHGAWFGAFENGRLQAQLGVCDAGGGRARYQDVETDPAARRQGLAGTLVWRAGRWAQQALGATTLVIVADPAEMAIRVYRSAGFADAQSVLSFARPPAG